MNQIEKAIEHLKENPHLIEEFATQYDAVVPKRVVKFIEEVQLLHVVEYELEIPTHVGRDDKSVRAYIQEHADEVMGALDEKVDNGDWAVVGYAESTGYIDMVLTTERGEKQKEKGLGRM